MNITDGLMISNQIINWDISLEEFKLICRKNKIDHKYEKIGKLVRISLPFEFANLGIVQATIYFINNSINEVYITNLSEDGFDIERYINVNNKLITYFGKPKLHKINKTLWKWKNIELKHFYINKDDIKMDYLVLDYIPQ